MSRTYFLEAFFNALATFFETKMPIIDSLLSAQDSTEANHAKQLDGIQRNLYEKFLIKVTMQHREHIILEFCDQVNIEMQ